MTASSVSPLDILMLAPVALPGVHGIGGVQRIVSRQARWLAGRGHRVRVVTSAHPSGAPTLTQNGVAYVFLGLDKGLGHTTGCDPFTVSRWRAATRDAWPALLADGVPEVVHGHAEAELGLVSAGLVGRGALPAVSTLYGSTLSGLLDHLRLADKYRAATPARERAPGGGHTRRAARSARGALGVVPTLGSARWLRRTQVVALSHRHARLVRLSYGVGRVEVISPGVDTVLYHPPDPAVRRTLREHFRIAPDAFTWGLVGRVGPGKGVDVAIEALARMPRGEPAPDVVLVAGSGPFEPTCRALAASLGLTERVVWAGDTQPPAAAYMCADALVFPTSHEESFGLAALEAMSCGVPVIARDRGAVPEVLDGTGVLVAGDDPGAWAGTMISLRSDASARARMAAAGRVKAVRAHNRLRTVRALESLYKSVAAQGGQR